MSCTNKKRNISEVQSSSKQHNSTVSLLPNTSQQAQLQNELEKKRRPFQKRRKYSIQNLDQAVADVRAFKYTIRGAARVHQIPEATIRRRVNGKVQDDARLGGPTRLGSEIEDELVDLFLAIAEYGVGVQFYEVQGIIQDFLGKKGKSHIFSEGRPGYKWFKLFKKRHPIITLDVPESVAKNQATAFTRKNVSRFFKIVEDQLDYLKYRGFKLTPNHIWNCDEIGASAWKDAEKVFTKRGASCVQATCDNEKLYYAVHVCCNAAGEFLPPFMLYKLPADKPNICKEWMTGGLPGAAYDSSSSGWMEKENFTRWLEQVFIPFVSHLEGPKLLYLDGQNSHMSLECLELAVEHEIIIIRLFPHTTHKLQPLDIAVFKPARVAWKEILREHFHETGFKGFAMVDFPKLLGKLWQCAMKPEHAISGFKKCGLWPFNKMAMREEDFARLTVFESNSDLDNSTQEELVNDNNENSGPDTDSLNSKDMQTRMTARRDKMKK